MTQANQVRTIELPPPEPPILTRMVTQSLLPTDDGREMPVIWLLGKENPIDAGMKVIRMLLTADGDVEIYSMPSNGAGDTYWRHTIPKSMIRVTKEMMPVDVFIDELIEAESGDDDDDDPDDPNDPEFEPEQTQSSQVDQSNGQATT